MNEICQTIGIGLLFLIIAICGCSSPGVATEPETPRMVPDFTLDQCMNADTLRLSDVRDHPVLLYFFDAGDVVGRYAFRYLNEWDRRYKGDGLRIICIHCPALEVLRVWENAIIAISRADAEVPVGMDIERQVYRAYSLETLPAFLLLKPGGEVVLETSKRRAFTEIEQAIQELLKAIKPDTIHPFLLRPFNPLDDPKVKILNAMPAIMLGYGPGAVADLDSTGFGKYRIYSDSRARQKGKVFLGGNWKVDETSVSYEQIGVTAEGSIRVVYSGKDVWLLADFSHERPPRIFVKQDKSYLITGRTGLDIRFDPIGRPYIELRYPVPVHIVTNRAFGAHELELVFTGGDATVYYLFFEDGLAE
jgi:hypothetical protein